MAEKTAAEGAVRLTSDRRATQTGWGQSEDRERTHETGFDRHMVRPVALTALMKLLDGLSNAARK